MTSAGHHYITILIIIVLINSVLSQDCIFSGKPCSNDASCCGGCCKNNICIDTYRSCIVHEDLCLERECPPGQECYIFQPDCVGCEASPECRESNIEMTRTISPQAIQV